MTGTSESERERYLRDGWWREGTFLDDLRRHAERQPGKPAVIARRTPDSPTETLSYAELAAATDRYARSLLALDVKPGEYVGIHRRPGPRRRPRRHPDSGPHQGRHEPHEHEHARA
jgi:non-ribosomal peptide synthetase component E (peptide arylation enzyme)